MGSLLIVDDEQDILETLEELFKYESGLEVDVYVAKSAKAAVELLEKRKFDVVMTDIKMPGMSGIELFHLIKENWPKCRVIFLTGYRDFDDLYEIMGNKDVRYLLKSEEYDVLVRNVAEAFQEIEDMMCTEIQETRHQQDIRQAQLVLKQNYLHECFQSGRGETLTQEKLNQAYIPLLLEKPLFIFLMRVDHFIEESGFEESLKREHILNDTIQEFLPIRMRYCLYYDAKGYYLIFLQPDRFAEDSLPARTWNRLYANLAGAMEYMQEKLLESASLSVSFVTCEDRCYLTDGRTYLNRLKQEAFGRIGKGEQIIIVAKANLPFNALQDNSLNYQLQIKHLEEFLESKKYADFIKEFRWMTSIISESEEEKSGETAEIYYSISILLLRYIRINHLKDKMQDEFSIDKLLDIEKHESRKNAAEYLNSVANAMIQELESEGRNRTSEVLEKVAFYVDTHLSDDLTLTKLADICYLNPSYLSRIFKQTYGFNITEYISKKRFERVKELLETTSKKIQDICAEVGYFSVPSFNRIFKKETGMSPIEYRNRYGDKNHELL